MKYSELKQLIESVIRKVLSENSDNEIYLNLSTSKYFSLPYDNKNELTIINAKTLYNYLKSNGKLDSAHDRILRKYFSGSGSQDLNLKGIHHGWWKIL